MFRVLIAFLVSCALVFTSHISASARGASVAVDRMVICTGTGPVVVYVDADGTPTAAPHHCPDCTLQMPDMCLQPDADVTAIGEVISLTRSAVDRSVPHRTTTVFRVRGPPFLY